MGNVIDFTAALKRKQQETALLEAYNRLTPDSREKLWAYAAGLLASEIDPHKCGTIADMSMRDVLKSLLASGDSSRKSGLLLDVCASLVDDQGNGTN